eukprot:gene9052-11088_t
MVVDVDNRIHIQSVLGVLRNFLAFPKGLMMQVYWLDWITFLTNVNSMVLPVDAGYQYYEWATFFNLEDNIGIFSATCLSTVDPQVEDEMNQDNNNNNSTNDQFHDFIVNWINEKYPSIGLCCDFQALNAIKVRELYPVPRINEMLIETGGVHYMSKIDLKWGFWHIKTVINKSSMYTNKLCSNFML